MTEDEIAALSDEDLIAAWHAAEGDDLALICGELERRGIPEPMPW